MMGDLSEAIKQYAMEYCSGKSAAEIFNMDEPEPGYKVAERKTYYSSGKLKEK